MSSALRHKECVLWTSSPSLQIELSLFSLYRDLFDCTPATSGLHNPRRKKKKRCGHYFRKPLVYNTWEKGNWGFHQICCFYRNWELVHMQQTLRQAWSPPLHHSMPFQIVPPYFSNNHKRNGAERSTRIRRIGHCGQGHPARKDQDMADFQKRSRSLLEV